MKTTSGQDALTATVDELTFRSYAHNRMLSPHITPEQWALIYSNVPEMEERFLRTFIVKLIEAADELGGEIGHA